MEYCGRVIKDEGFKKKISGIFGAVVVLTFMIGMVLELPAMRFSSGDADYASAQESLMDDGRGRSISGDNRDTFKGISALEIPSSGLEDSLRYFNRERRARKLSAESFVKGRDDDFERNVPAGEANHISSFSSPEIHTTSGENVYAEIFAVPGPVERNAENHVPAALTGNLGSSFGFGSIDSEVPSDNMASKKPVLPESAADGTVSDEPETTPMPGDSADNIVVDGPADVVLPNPPAEEETPGTDIPTGGAPEDSIPGTDIPADGVPDENTPGADIPTDEVPDESIPETDVPSDEGTGTVPAEGFLISEEGLIYGYNPEAGLVADGESLALPSEGCSGIAFGAFDGVGAGIVDIYIPANITYIEDGALAGLTDLQWIETDAANPNYASPDGILFDSSMTSLLAFPGGRIGSYLVPEYVTRFADYAFAGSLLDRIDMRACSYVEVGSAVFGEGGGFGKVVAVPVENQEEYIHIFSSLGATVESNSSYEAEGQPDVE